MVEARAEVVGVSARRTPLYERHRALGARMTVFADWEMPLQYTGILEEHRAVRQAAGLFDVSHMGELRLRGPAALQALDWLCTNDPRRLSTGRGMYTLFCDAEGGTVDDGVVYCLAAGSDYLLVVNAARVEADLSWMRAELEARPLPPGGWNLEDMSAATALLALQGPAAAAILGSLLGEDGGGVLALRPFHLQPEVVVAGCRCLVARTGYTGEDGFELACDPQDAVTLWDALLAAGAPRGCRPAGLGARDTLRLEAALPLYGHELSASVSPLEAGLGRFVRLDGREFCGAAALRRQQARGPQRALVGLLPDPPAIARAGAAVRRAGGEVVGQVSSGSFGPTLGRAVALALCASDALAAGAPLEVEVRGRWVPAARTPLPFYRRPPAAGAP